MAGEKIAKSANGLHIQDWFHPTTFDLRADLQAAAISGKNLVILFEQDGCIYCKKLHEENFAKPEILDLLTEKYLMVQLDMWGGNARSLTLTINR